MPKLPDGVNSFLSIVELGIAPNSLRGISQTLEHIAAASNMRRTASGELVDISASQFRKYRSVVRCTDISSPGLDGVWPGMTLTVHCAAELGVEGDTGTTGLGRTASPNSIREADGFTFYRPVLTMMLVGYREDFQEWASWYSWELILEEV